MNSRAIFTLGGLVVAFFWIVTPSRSQYFVPESGSGDPTLEAKLQAAYDQVYGSQPTDALRKTLVDAENAWQTYRVSEATWEAGTSNPKSPDFQRVMKAITMDRITELNHLISIHPVEREPSPEASPTPPYLSVVRNVDGQRNPGVTVDQNIGILVNNRIPNFGIDERLPGNAIMPSPLPEVPNRGHNSEPSSVTPWI